MSSTFAARDGHRRERTGRKAFGFALAAVAMFWVTFLMLFVLYVCSIILAGAPSPAAPGEHEITRRRDTSQGPRERISEVASDAADSGSGGSESRSERVVQAWPICRLLRPRRIQEYKRRRTVASRLVVSFTSERGRDDRREPRGRDVARSPHPIRASGRGPDVRSAEPRGPGLQVPGWVARRPKSDPSPRTRTPCARGLFRAYRVGVVCIHGVVDG